MVNDLDEDFDEEFAEIRKEYLKELPAKIQLISENLEKGLGGDDKALHQATFLAHRLSGSAGSYGLPELGAEAKKLEQFLIDFKNKTPSSEEQAKARELFTELKAVSQNTNQKIP